MKNNLAGESSGVFNIAFGGNDDSVPAQMFSNLKILEAIDKLRGIVLLFGGGVEVSVTLRTSAIFLGAEPCNWITLMGPAQTILSDMHQIHHIIRLNR